MARKKKQLTRAEKKRRRQEMVARKRRETGWEPPTPAPKLADDVIKDMLPLFPLAGAGPIAPADIQELMTTILDTADLVDEPEFEDMIIDPMLTVDTFASVGLETGIEPEDLVELPEAERGEKHLAMLDMTGQRLLTDDIREDIIERLNKLRLRLRQSDRKRKTARVAALQSFLGGDEEPAPDLWSAIGLVQAIVQRSLEAGFALFGALEEATEAADVKTTELSSFLLKQTGDSSMTSKLEQTITKTPGLGKYLERQVDQIWDEGMKALYTGQLRLGLFTDDELEAGAEMAQDAFFPGGAKETDPQEIEPIIDEQRAERFFSAIQAYLAELLTPERLDQLKERFNTILEEEDFPKKRTSFMVMISNRLAEEDAPGWFESFFIRSFLGQLFTDVLSENSEAKQKLVMENS